MNRRHSFTPMLLSLVATATLTVLASAPATAQFTQVGSAYYTTADHTLNTDINGNIVFVGKDPATFATLAGTITLTVSDGAFISQGGGRFPDGRFYSGVTVFGNHQLNIIGGSMNGSRSYDSSIMNVSGGSTGAAGYGISHVNISGGDHYVAIGRETATVNITGGNVFEVDGFGTSTTNISGGTIEYIYALENSVFNLTGGAITSDGIYQIDDTATVNVFGLGITYSGAVAGIEPVDDLPGVYYDMAWTRPDAVVVNTRYFDGGGNVANATPQGITFTLQAVTVPEPGSLALILPALGALGAVVATRRKQAGRSQAKTECF